MRGVVVRAVRLRAAQGEKDVFGAGEGVGTYPSGRTGEIRERVFQTFAQGARGRQSGARFVTLHHLG
jgi:hypothetical protein